MPTDATHAGVDHRGVQDESVEVLILVHREHPAALARVSGRLGEERESPDSVPLLEELEKLRGRGVHLGAGQDGPSVLGKPKDFRVEVRRAELAVVQVRERVEGRAQVPLNSSRVNLTDADPGSGGGSHPEKLGGLWSWTRAELEGSRKVRGASRRLRKAVHLRVKDGQVISDSAKLVEGPAEVATGAEPQAHQRPGNHVQAVYLTGLLQRSRDADPASRRADHRVAEGLPVQGHDPEPDELPDRGGFSPTGATPRRASPSVH